MGENATLKQVNIGILGLGTVGSAVVNVWRQNRDEIERRTGASVNIAKVALRDLNKERTCDLTGIEVTNTPSEIVEDNNIDIVVELMGGIEPAKSLILTAIKNGKQVVTANKALIAEEGNEIFAEATKTGSAVLYEAAVAGGIPIVKTLRESLGGNHIQSIVGIINGTANYILTNMSQEKCDFETALKMASEAGYAEADPSFDVDSIDAGHKITILASLAFGIPLQFGKIHMEGIRHIHVDDIAHADEMGYVIKQLAFAKRVPDTEGFAVYVCPTLLPKGHILTQVDGVMNAVYVMADAVGPTLYSGAGAGGMPTASAVFADIVEAMRIVNLGLPTSVPHLAFQHQSLSNAAILPIEEVVSANYLRIEAADKLGTFAQLSKILTEEEINIDTIVQEHDKAVDDKIPIVLLTHPTTERQMQSALKAISALPMVSDRIQRIRLDRLEVNG